MSHGSATTAGSHAAGKTSHAATAGRHAGHTAAAHHAGRPAGPYQMYDSVTPSAIPGGKPIAAVPEEIGFAVDNLRFFAGAARLLEGRAAGERNCGLFTV